VSLTGALVLLANNALALGFLALCQRCQGFGWLRPSNIDLPHKIFSCCTWWRP
jgi:hypothetical protein